MSNQKITYDINVSHVSIIQNILKQQIPCLLDQISVKENIDRSALEMCVKRINRSNERTGPRSDATE